VRTGDDQVVAGTGQMIPITRNRALSAIALLFALTLAGCTLVDADSQLRVTEHTGAGTAGLLVGGAELMGIGCIVSVAGELPHALELAYVGDRCNVHYNRRDDSVFPFGE